MFGGYHNKIILTIVRVNNGGYSDFLNI